MKKTVVFDFDGVIHSYTSGWQGSDVANDPVVPGIGDLIERLRRNDYEVVVVSTRCKTIDGKECIMDYLDKNQIEVDRILASKPPAICYIDDRAIRFDGKVDGLFEEIKSFRPWHDKESESLATLKQAGKMLDKYCDLVSNCDICDIKKICDALDDAFDDSEAISERILEIAEEGE